MLKIPQKLLIICSILVLLGSPLKADAAYFLDFKFILNQSNAGKKAQKFLQNKLEKGVENLKQKEKKLQEDEKKLIQQKN